MAGQVARVRGRTGVLPESAPMAQDETAGATPPPQAERQPECYLFSSSILFWRGSPVRWRGLPAPVAPPPRLQPASRWPLPNAAQLGPPSTAASATGTGR